MADKIAACRCGATNYYQHVERLVGGNEAHDYQLFIGDPTTWDA